MLITFHPFGIENPLKIKSLIVSSKVPWTGGASLITLQATIQEYLILLMSSQFNNSPPNFDFAISICSKQIAQDEHKDIYHK